MIKRTTALLLSFLLCFNSTFLTSYAEEQPGMGEPAETAAEDTTEAETAETTDESEEPAATISELEEQESVIEQETEPEAETKPESETETVNSETEEEPSEITEEPAETQIPTDETAETAEQPEKIQISFEKNQPEAEGEMAPQVLTSGEEGTLTSNLFSCSGYRFAGWNTEADGSGISYTEGASISLESDVTLYAQWEKSPESALTVDNTDLSEQEEDQIIEEAEEEPEELLNAGSLKIESHTKDEIIAFMNANPVRFLPAAYTEEPSEANVTAGKLTDAVQQDALNALNQIRFIAGVPADVTLNDEYITKAQAASFVDYALDDLTHKPGRPENWGSEFDEIYNLGKQGAASTNIGWAYPAWSLADTVIYGWMEDGDDSNISRVGHRRWVINPSMAMTGFGQTKEYTAMYSFDRSRPAESSDYVSVWPAPYTPVDYFLSDFPWSYSSGNRNENISNIKVTLKRLSDDTVWNFSSSSADGYFNVDTGGYGLPGCVIFRPNNIKYSAGDRFNVTITGLADGDISYDVEFFKGPDRPVAVQYIVPSGSSSVSITVGDTKQLQWQIVPSDASNKNVICTTENENIAAVNENGVVTAVGEGTTKIHISAADGYGAADCIFQITVKPKPVYKTDYKWEKTDTGYQVIATATVEGQPELTQTETVEAVYTITEKPACAEDGKGLYTATFSNSLFSTQTKEEVIPQIGHLFKFTHFTWEGSGDKTSAYANYVCEHDSSHTWVIGAGITSQRTEPTCEEDGSIEYTASIKKYESVDGEAHTEIKTEIIPATGHKWGEPSYVWTKTGDGYSVTATAECQSNASHKLTETVNAVLQYTDETKGQYVAEFTTAQFHTQTKEIVFVSGVTMNTYSLTMKEGEGYALIATVEPANATDSNVSWKSTNTEAATVDQNGFVKAVGLGSASIIATAGGKTASCDVTVTDGKIHVTGISFKNSEETTGVDGKFPILPIISPEDATDKEFTLESSNPAVVKVSDQKGYVETLSTGTAVITATTHDGNYSATYTLHVLPLANELILTPDHISMTVKDEQTITWKTKPEEVYYWGVSWESDMPVVATVDSNGKVKALSQGTAVISARISPGGNEEPVIAKCIVTVDDPSAIKVTGITLDQTTLTMTEGGDDKVLKANISPVGATNRNVTWTSNNPDVAKVMTDGMYGLWGVVTPVNPGTATITATTNDGNKTASCTVTVQPITLKLNKNKLSLESGNSETLTATVSPSDAPNMEVTWSTSNETVATVDSNGKVTGHAGGTAIITAKTESGASATCNVTVTIPVEGVYLNKTDLTLKKGESITLTARIRPSTATNRNKTWTSSNPSVATVDANGKITAKAAGTATITVKSAEGGKTDTCKVTVTEAATDTIDMYRMYNPNSGEHFYTGNVAERDFLISVGWNYEGVGFKAPKKSNTPMYRLYNPNAGDHHYTSNVAEKNHLVSVGWNYEGIGWYADDNKEIPQYRLYNPNATGAGSHHYTSNIAERDHLISLGWKDEGIGFYTCR